MCSQGWEMMLQINGRCYHHHHHNSDNHHGHHHHHHTHCHWKCLGEGVAPGRTASFSFLGAPNIFLVSLPESGSGFERHLRHLVGQFNVLPWRGRGLSAFLSGEHPRSWLLIPTKKELPFQARGGEPKAKSKVMHKRLCVKWRRTLSPLCFFYL